MDRRLAGRDRLGSRLGVRRERRRAGDGGARATADGAGAAVSAWIRRPSRAVVRDRRPGRGRRARPSPNRPPPLAVHAPLDAARGCGGRRGPIARVEPRGRDRSRAGPRSGDDRDPRHRAIARGRPFAAWRAPARAGPRATEPPGLPEASGASIKQSGNGRRRKAEGDGGRERNAGRT